MTPPRPVAPPSPPPPATPRGQSSSLHFSGYGDWLQLPPLASFRALGMWVYRSQQQPSALQTLFVVKDVGAAAAGRRLLQATDDAGVDSTSTYSGDFWSMFSVDLVRKPTTLASLPVGWSWVYMETSALTTLSFRFMCNRCAPPIVAVTGSTVQCFPSFTPPPPKERPCLVRPG
jgi:hypothetical protein